MPWHVEYDQDQDTVVVVFSGDTDASDIREATIDGINLVKKHRAMSGLVDCLEQTKTGSIMQLYELPTLYDDEGLTHRIRIAFVEPAKKELRELADFYETVCLNRGWQIRRFATREAALDWLRLAASGR